MNPNSVTLNVSSGPIITEWSSEDDDIESSTLVDKNKQVKPVSLDSFVYDPKGSHGATNQAQGSEKVDMNSHGAVGIDKVGVDALKQPPTSFACATSNEPKKYTSNFRRMECSMKSNGVDLFVPMKVVEEVNTRFENTLYRYFLGQRLAFPIVDYYVRNAWAKFGIQKVMMNAKGFFFFKFNSKKIVDEIKVKDYLFVKLNLLIFIHINPKIQLEYPLDCHTKTHSYLYPKYHHTLLTEYMNLITLTLHKGKKTTN